VTLRFSRNYDDLSDLRAPSSGGNLPKSRYANS
jgi:hypothetical protein